MPLEPAQLGFFAILFVAYFVGTALGFGTSVISVPFHHPFHVAERMAFLDHLTRGRAILGVGPIPRQGEDKVFPVGAKRDDPGAFIMYAEKAPNARGVRRPQRGCEPRRSERVNARGVG